MLSLIVNANNCFVLQMLSLLRSRSYIILFDLLFKLEMLCVIEVAKDIHMYNF